MHTIYKTKTCSSSKRKKRQSEEITRIKETKHKTKYQLNKNLNSNWTSAKVKLSQIENLLQRTPQPNPPQGQYHKKKEVNKNSSND